MGLPASAELNVESKKTKSISMWRTGKDLRRKQNRRDPQEKAKTEFFGNSGVALKEWGRRGAVPKDRGTRTFRMFLSGFCNSPLTLDFAQRLL